MDACSTFSMSFRSPDSPPAQQIGLHQQKEVSESISARALMITNNSTFYLIIGKKKHSASNALSI